MLIENKGKKVEFMKCNCIAKNLEPCCNFLCAISRLQPQTELSNFPWRPDVRAVSVFSAIQHIEVPSLIV